MFNKIIDWFKNNIFWITNTKLHFKIGTKTSVPLMIIGILLSIIFHNVYIAITIALFWKGILIGYEANQHIVWGFSHWFKTKFFDSITDVIAGGIVADVILVIYLLI
jgi:hypothetical protein